MGETVGRLGGVAEAGMKVQGFLVAGLDFACASVVARRERRGEGRWELSTAEDNRSDIREGGESEAVCDTLGREFSSRQGPSLS